MFVVIEEETSALKFQKDANLAGSRCSEKGEGNLVWEEALKPVYIKHCIREQHPAWPDGQLFEM